MLYPEDSDEALFATQGYPPVRKCFSIEENLAIAKEMSIFNRGAGPEVPDEILNAIGEEYKTKYREARYRILVHYHTLMVKKLNAQMAFNPVPQRSLVAISALTSIATDIVISFNQLNKNEQTEAVSILNMIAMALGTAFKTQAELPFGVCPPQYIKAIADFWKQQENGIIPLKNPLIKNQELLTYAFNTLTGQDEEWAKELMDCAKIMSLRLDSTTL